jgi:DNA (cytosine-5)-methyltransferase 1
MNVIDLFCGCGGLSLGLEQSGCNIVAGIDNWPKALQTYKRNFPHPCHEIDIAKASLNDIVKECALDMSKIDVWVGGPPCQGFSVQRIGPDVDQRNNLVIHYLSLAIEAQANCILMENVPGIRGKRGQKILDLALKTLTEKGYVYAHGVLNAADFGIPQIRKRYFLLALRRDLQIIPNLPSPPHPSPHRPVLDVIGDLPEPLQKSDTDDPLHYAGKLSPLNAKRIALIKPGKGFESLPPTLRADCHKRGAEEIGHRYVYGRMSPDEPASTITGRFDSFTRGRFGHPVHPRNITLREGARIQSFPDSFLFSGTQEEIAAQIGNAVPPSLGIIWGKHIQRLLSKS